LTEVEEAMTQRTLTAVAIFLMFAAVLIGAQGQTGEERFKAGQHAERTSGIDAAIQIYLTIPRDFSGDRPLMAKTLLQLGKNYELLGKDADAQTHYERVVKDYADQTLPATEAKAKIKARTNPGIFIAQMDPRTGTIRGPITAVTETPDIEALPTFSPDGKSIAFRRRPATTQNLGGAGLYSLVVRSLETKVEQISQAGNPAGAYGFGHSLWLKDGKTLLTLIGAGAVINVSSNTLIGQNRMDNGLAFETKLRSGFAVLMDHAALSPDEKTLYAYTGSGPIHIVAPIDLATGDQREPYPMPLLPGNDDTGVGQINWKGTIRVSPDGRTLAVAKWSGSTKDSRLVLMNAEGADRNYREIVKDFGRIQDVYWKDGRNILFAKSDVVAPNRERRWHIMQVPAEVGGTPVFTGLEVTGLGYFDLSSDGTQIVFDGVSARIAPALPPPPPPAPPATNATPCTQVPSIPASAAMPGPRGGVAQGPRGNVDAAPATQAQVSIVDRQGQLVSTLREPIPIGATVLSPDGTRIAFARNGDIWAVDVATGKVTQVTSDPGVESSPVWAPDGKRLAYLSIRAACPAVYVRAADGTGLEEPLYQVDAPRGNASAGRLAWSSPMPVLLAGTDVWALPLQGERKPIPVMRDAGGNVTVPRLSPDGGFHAFVNASGDVLVRSFERAHAEPFANFTQRKVAGARGISPRWNGAGTALYYLANDGSMMTVPVSTSPELTLGPSSLLFKAPAGFPVDATSGAQFDVSADGQRFMFLIPVR
jgi:Tol biopolymer transport system component